MMFTKQVESFEAWTRPTKAAFDFWVSFWPVAPAFGVEWRFADAMPRFTPRILETGMEADDTSEPANAPSKAKAPQKAARKAKTAQPHAEPAIEVIEAVEEAIAPLDAVVEAAIENVAGIVDSFNEAVVAKVAPAADAETSGVAGKPAGLLDAAPDAADDLKLIKGVGPALEKQLNGLGVYTFAQIAGFSEADLAWIDDNLTAFKGRCFRDDWIGQARSRLG